MLFASFNTDAPLGHVQRALDELARVGFNFCTLEVSAPGEGPEPRNEGHVRIGFRAAGIVPPETLVARLARIPGIRDVRGE